MDKTYDFEGWATKANVKCSDGRVIMKDAFKHNDGEKVPLVWNHRHDDCFNVLGYAELEHREEGMYAYCTFNDTEQGKNGKSIVQHGDVVSLSIYANRLKQNGHDVMHGDIREVSLVLAGANPEATILNVIAHGEELNDEADLYFNQEILLHTDEEEKSNMEEKTEVKKEEKEETVEDVYNSLTEKQKKVVAYLVGVTLEDYKKELDNEEDEEMKHNIFDKETGIEENTLSHSEFEGIMKDAKRIGSLREAFNTFAEKNDVELTHGDQDYGIKDIDYLFPDARNVNNVPDFIQRDMGWVEKVMSGAKHSPFSRIKTVHADIREDEARARGYIKGNKKKEEVFSLLKRSTTPTTIYKKQKIDRDDAIDITDFDVVSWLKGEMRMMLNEEIARAVLIGDGRPSSSDDAINTTCIRPIYGDDDLYTINKAFTKGASELEDAKAFITNIIKARKDYKGSGNPTLYTTEDMLTACLLLEDVNGRYIYESEEKLRTTLRVKEIVTVPVMENTVRTEGNFDYELAGIIVNMNDYTIGADKGGAINMFDDFDINFNQQLYLIETRCSGALTKPFSAITLEIKSNHTAG